MKNTELEDTSKVSLDDIEWELFGVPYSENKYFVWCSRCKRVKTEFLGGRPNIFKVMDFEECEGWKVYSVKRSIFEMMPKGCQCKAIRKDKQG